MANFALNYSFSRNLNIPLDEDAVKVSLAEVVNYVQTMGKCYAGQLFSVTGDTEVNNGLYIALTTGAEGQVIKLASQNALDAVAASAGKIDKIQLNGTELTINDKVVNIDLSTYATIEYVDSKISGLTEVYAPKAEFEEVQKKVDEITSTGGEPNVQSDWDTTDETADSFIKNKPDLNVFAKTTAVTEDIATAFESGISYTDTKVKEVSDVVSVLVGEDASKSARAIAAEEVAKVVASADTDFDTLKEIADWIKNDTTGAANMANDIAALKEADIALDGRLDIVEGAKHTHSNKDVLDGISSDKVAAWDAAEQNAKDYANGLAGNYDAVGSAESALTEAKSYVDDQVAEAILSANTAASNAQAAAKTYTDGQVAEAILSANTAASNAQAAAKTYTDTEIGKLGNIYATTGSVDTLKTTLENKISTDIADLKDVYDIKGAAEGALGEAKVYADGLAKNYDKVGAAAQALIDAKAYADGLAGNYDTAGSAEQALKDAKDYADGLAVNYDAVGSAEQALKDAKDYADGLAVNYDAAGAAVSAAASALTDAKNFTLDEIAKLSEVYDVKGAANSAETAAKKYTDDKLVDYATKSYVTDTIVGQLSGGTVVIEGYAKVEEVKAQVASAKTEAIAAAEAYADGLVTDENGVSRFDAAGSAAAAQSAAEAYADGLAKNYDAAGSAAQALTDAKAYVDAISANTRLEALEAIDHDKLVADAIAEVVASADTSFDTLKEIADWILNDTTGAAKMANDIEDLKKEDIAIDGRLDALEAISGQSHVHDNKEVLDGISSEKVAAWDAAEQNAKDYADGLADNYDAAGSAAQALTDAKAYADGLAVNYDAAGSAAAAQSAAEADATTKANTAEQNAKDYADSLAGNYDVAGAAASALTEAKSYADGLVENIKPYEGGVAANIAMGENDTYVVDVKVSDAEQNFLHVNADNELEVSAITLDAAVTSKDIVIEGGQWESMVKTVYTGGTVPAGTTWESFLEAMLCVEKFPGTISTTSAFTVSCGNINPGVDKSGTVEVGTKVTLNKTVANDTTASQTITVGTFSGAGKTYGYKLGEKGSHVNSKTYSEKLEPSLKTSSKALKITFSGFVDAVNSGSAITTKTGEGEIAAVTMYAMSGTNKVVVYQSGDTYTSSSAVTAGTIYAATNLKNYYKSDKVTPNTHTPSCPVVDKMATDSTEYTVTGAFKYFIGDITAVNPETGRMDAAYAATYWDTDRSDLIQNFATSGWANTTTITSEHEYKKGTTMQVVAVPAKYTTVTAQDANKGGVTFNLVKTFDFTNAQGYISSYNVFVAPSYDGLGSDSKITFTSIK